MSGIAAVFERSGAPVEAGALDAIMRRMAHRGPEGHDVRFERHAALGHWHLATTPEEAGERQPLSIDGLPFSIVLDGRLDNRADVISALGISAANGRAMSDAALMLHAYERWGERCVEHFIGEFALAIVDSHRGELFCARDAMGERTMFYRFEGTRVLVASEPWAIAAPNGNDCELDDTGIAHFFAMEASEDGRTFFRGVFELLPAEVMVVKGESERRRRYWEPDPAVRRPERSDREHGEAFLAVLEESVRCRLRATTRVGVQMSGGLDSGSVACLAARMLAPEALTTVSWVFDELSECDERGYIDTVRARWGTRSIQVKADDAWPMRGLSDWPRSPNQPEQNAYRNLKERVFARARQEGLGVLLTGCYGDDLYSSAADWIVDLIAEGRVIDAAAGLAHTVRSYGIGSTIRSRSLRRLGTRLFGAAIQDARGVEAAGCARPWLTTEAARSITVAAEGIDRAAEIRRLVARMRCGESSGALVGLGVELRHPYRDRRLVELVLSMPAHQAYNRNGYKHVLRTAMKGILPEPIRQRSSSTSLEPLFRLGVRHELPAMSACLGAQEAEWSRFVKPEWVRDRVSAEQMPRGDGGDVLVPWLCVSYESWRRAASSPNTLEGAINATQ